MKLKIWQLPILFFVLSITSCMKFLEEKPDAFIDPDQFYKDEQQANSGVVGIYATLSDFNAYGSFYNMSDLPSDLMEPGYQGNQSTTSMDSYTFDSNNDIIAAYWRVHYMGINRANLAINKINLMEGNINPAIKNQLLAEARFLRGLFYFNMVRWFGKIPLSLNYVSSLDEVNLPQSDAATVYETIIGDLTFAGEHLPESMPAGRATVYAAKTLLGKVYLTLGRWEPAVDQLESVIGKHSLFSSYGDVWTNANKNGKEFIFCVQYKAGIINSSYSVNFAPRSSGIQAVQSYGEMAVETGFYNSFAGNDARKQLIRTSYPKYDGSGTANFNKPYSFKYFDLAEGGLSGVNYPVLRYADVLLMYAEAKNEIQYGSVEAFDAINKIRDRANVNLYDVQNFDQQSFRQAVWQERAWELAFEGHRWFDLVRTGQLVQTISQTGKQIFERNKVFPIPQREMDVNKLLKQNDSY
ncbi:RagB/SusD family nutrient uptake outer membrane protein [Gynurincola endophyticus]|jgi:hypothetical protein|uniref:RagB/SusD family nutrient uptake outer membrane protein n=1 Tax=Gynurincola endophyticus TaxID=2479004 RepID=UPI000F8E7C3A|nr:RagB/SusD family nutrient uptake outer membrane protein [Gynurincola endophyticus]